MHMQYELHTDQKPQVQSFFDNNTNTVTHVVSCEETRRCAVIDSVMDYEPNGATISFENADKVIHYIEQNQYKVDWILETHVHADHLSAAPYIQEKLGGKIAIGEKITDVQNIFGKVFNVGTEFQKDGSQFDRLWKDGDTFTIGNLNALVIHVPGHTPADVAYVIGDAIFPGDTIFMPDYGSARCDFPGGSAEKLYNSVQKLLSFPSEMRMFLCHDYLPSDRNQYAWETTVDKQRKYNIHFGNGTSMERFTEMRETRDATLIMPKLIIPSIQVNMNAGHLPKAENGNSDIYLKIPVNNIFSTHQKND